MGTLFSNAIGIGGTKSSRRDSLDIDRKNIEINHLLDEQEKALQEAATKEAATKEEATQKVNRIAIQIITILNKHDTALETISPKNKCSLKAEIGRAHV